MYQPNGASPLCVRTWRMIAMFVLAFWGICPTFLFAQAQNQPSQPSISSPENRQEDSIEQLKRKVEQIHKQYQKELSELQERLGLIEKQQSTLSDELSQNVKVGGYGVVSFESFRNQKTTNDGKFELLISGQFHDRIRFYNEIDLGVPGGTALVEQGYVDLLLTQAFNFRAGVLLTPFGKVNLDHFDPRRELTSFPSVARLVTPATWSDLGFGAFGLVLVSDNVKATYEIQMINGLTDQFAVIGTTPDLGLRNARTRLRTDNNGDKAVVGRGTLKFFDQYEIGFSGYRGEYKPGSSDLITGMALDAEFRPRNVSVWENFVFRSEFARFDIQGSTAPSSLWGYYAQLTYRFWPSGLNSTVLGRHFNNPTFALVGQYGYTKINTTASSSGSLTEEQYVVGFNYRPVEDYVIKTEYQFNNGQLDRRSSDGFFASVSWLF